MRNPKTGEKILKLVFLDTATVGNDIDYSRFEEFGEVVTYDLTSPDEVPERLKDADICITNKVPMNEKTLKEAEKLKLICLTATGTNNLDKEYLEKRNIEWRNVAGYSTDCVAQHTFAMTFYLLEKLAYYDSYVKSGEYIKSPMFTDFSAPFDEMTGKTWGIIGLGAIGKRVAKIAEAFGCRIIYYSTSGRNNSSEYEQVDLDTLLGTSDIISVHAPLNENTEGMMNAEAFGKMKDTAIFINAGRGPIVVEEDLASALENKEIAAAGLDVLTVEPMREDNPLFRIKDSTKLLITPHIGWAGVSTRKRLMDIIFGHIREYYQKED